jgi:uncharacterized protein YukE
MVDNVPPGVGNPSVTTPPPPKKTGLFSPKTPVTDLNKAVSDLAGELNNVSRRMMVLEERYSNLRKKSDVSDQNMLANNKKIMTEIHAIHEELDEGKKQISDMLEKLRIIVRELKECAKNQDVEVLKKYINIWEPINFVTRDTVSRVIKDEVESQFKDLNIRLQQEDYIKEQIRLTLSDIRNDKN